VSKTNQQKSSSACALEDIEKIYAISDLHMDKIQNLQWLSSQQNTNDGTANIHNIPGPNDALIVAGDISHELSVLHKTLSTIVEKFQCKVFFVFGNHEAWVGGSEMDALGIKTSLEKIERVKGVCNELGVYTDYQLVGENQQCPVWIVPIEGWYDGSLTIPDTNDLCSNFNKWPWVDFFRCVWPEEHQPQIEHNGRIPVGLNERMLEWNTCAIDNLRADYRNRMFPKPDANEDNEAPSSPLRSLITFSHFLPNQQCLPDWKDVNCETFLKDEWFDHGAADTSAKFAKVAGSKNMDEQIRSIIPSSSSSSTLSEKNDVRHIHVFGHSHRPKDFTYKGVRYIHNPLGYSRERDMHMVSQDVNFQLIWDTTRAEGEVAGESVIRYWEEQGGGVEALQKRMILRRKKRGAVVRQLVEDTRKKVKK